MCAHPPRPGGATPAKASTPVEVVRLHSRRPAAPPSAPMPEPVRNALAAIAGDLRNMPRGCIGDPAELVHWLRRMANWVEGVGRMRVPGASPHPARPLPPPTSTLALAEAVFGKGPSSTRGAETRTITSRRGRAVRVEVRRAKAAGQFEMNL